MTCKKFQTLIPSYLDGELPGPETEDLREHLEQCSDCRALARKMRKSLQVFTALEPAGEELAVSPWLASKIAATAVERAPVRRPWRARLAVAFGMVLLIVGLSAGYVLRPYLLTSPKTVTESMVHQNSIRFQGEGIGVEIEPDRFVLHTADKQGRGGIDLKF